MILFWGTIVFELDILFRVWAFGWAVVMVDRCSRPNKAEGLSSIKVYPISRLLHPVTTLRPFFSAVPLREKKKAVS